jgi:hypothetical protein
VAESDNGDNRRKKKKIIFSFPWRILPLFVPLPGIHSFSTDSAELLTL